MGEELKTSPKHPGWWEGEVIVLHLSPQRGTCPGSTPSISSADTKRVSSGAGKGVVSELACFKIKSCREEEPRVLLVRSQDPGPG